MSEASVSFDCFGSTCGLHIIGDGPLGSATDALADAQCSLLAWHTRFTRFTATSELSELNRNPAPAAAVSSIMGRFIRAAVEAAAATEGLVDPTQLAAIESAGYCGDLHAPLPLELALRLAPARRPANPNPAARWAEVAVSPDGRTVRRPPGVGFDSGGVVKGLLADVLAERLGGYDAYAIDCAGDLRIGGAAREVRVSSPFDDSVIHHAELSDVGVATSGIGRRSWLRDGRPMHHLLDPESGRPAFTGVVQATAFAPTACEAEWRAKAAVLSGPSGAPRQLLHGGVLVFDDGCSTVVDAAQHSASSQRPARRASS